MSAARRGERRYRLHAPCSWQTAPSSQTQNVGWWPTASGHGTKAGSCSPALAQTVSHSSFSLRQVEISRK